MAKDRREVWRCNVKIFNCIVMILLWIIFLICIFNDEFLQAIIILLLIMNENIEKLNK